MKFEMSDSQALEFARYLRQAHYVLRVEAAKIRAAWFPWKQSKRFAKARPFDDAARKLLHHAFAIEADLYDKPKDKS